MSRSRPTLTMALLAALLTGVVACGVPVPMPTPTPTPSATVLPSGDGVLRMGTIFPSTGQVAFIGAGQVAGVETAVREINAAGGVNGAPMEVFHRDSADATTQKAEESLADLVTKVVDVVIGPSSSVLAERLAPIAVDKEIVMISPAATFPELTGLADDGYFFRTIPAHGHQGLALGEYLSAAGPVDVALVYLVDELGESIAETLPKALEDAGSKLVLAKPITVKDSNLAPIVAAVTAAKPDLLVLATPFSAFDQTKALITQFSTAGFGGTKLWLTTQNSADYSQALPPGLLKGVNGIIEGAEPDAAFKARLKQTDPALGTFKYAAEAYDATILAALAAIVSGDDSGASISATLRDVSRGGIKCTSFAECLDVLKTETDIDYDGISGPTNFTDEGDVQPAFYGIYTYNAENKFDFKTGIVAG